MRIDFNQILKTIEGEDFIDPNFQQQAFWQGYFARAIEGGMNQQVAELELKMKLDSFEKVKTTLKKVCVDALKFSFSTAGNMGQRMPEELSGEEKIKRGTLAKRIYKGSITDVKVEDIALIKKLTEKLYGVDTVCAVNDIFEGEKEEKEEEKK